MLVTKGISVLSKLIFVRKRCPEKRGIIGVERDHHALIEVAFYRMFGGRFAAACFQIACQANFNGNLAVRQFLDQVGILGGAERVTDPLGVEVERAPDGFGGPCFAGVHGQVQPVIFGVGVDTAKKLWRRLDLIASDADSHDVAVLVVRSELEHFLCFFDAEVAGRVENPEQRDAEIARSAGASAFESFKDCLKILLAVKAHTDRDIDFSVQNIFFFQLLHQAVGREFVIIGAAEMRADFLERHEEAAEVGVAIERFGFGEGCVFSVALAKFVQGGRLDGSFEMQVELRLGQLTDEGIWRIYDGGHNAIVDAKRNVGERGEDVFGIDVMNDDNRNA